MQEGTSMEVNELECRHCGHTWFPRYAHKPKVCPKCKRYRWEVIAEVNNVVEEQHPTPATPARE